MWQKNVWMQKFQWSQTTDRPKCDWSGASSLLYGVILSPECGLFNLCPTQNGHFLQNFQTTQKETSAFIPGWSNILKAEVPEFMDCAEAKGDASLKSKREKRNLQRHFSNNGEGSCIG